MRYIKQNLSLSLMLTLLLFSTNTAFAAAPIVNLSDPAVQQYTDASGQTMQGAAPANAQVNLLNRISQLQQSVRRLQGIVEVQQHQLALLKKQQLVLFSDVDKRLTALGAKPAKTNAPLGETSSLQTVNRISGSESISHNATNKTHGIAVVDQPKPAVNQTNTTVRFDEQQAYENAYQYVKQKRYSDAVFAMQQFLKDYPKSRYVSNAHYWLGEVYSVQGENKKAKTAFETVVEQYPDSPKAAGALLKLGYLDITNQDYGAARLVFQQVKARYPNTAEANLADAKNKELLRQGFI